MYPLRRNFRNYRRFCVPFARYVGFSLLTERELKIFKKSAISKHNKVSPSMPFVAEHVISNRSDAFHSTSENSGNLNRWFLWNGKRLWCPNETIWQQPFSSQLTKIKTMRKFLWPPLVINLSIPNLIWRGTEYFVQNNTTIVLPGDTRRTVSIFGANIEA